MPSILCRFLTLAGALIVLAHPDTARADSCEDECHSCSREDECSDTGVVCDEERDDYAACVERAESEGLVVRKWKRADLIIAWDSYYLTVDRTVFRVKPEDWIQVREDAYVKVVHFPNTLNVVSIHELRPPAAPPPPAPPDL